MDTAFNRTLRFLAEEDGATATEYAFMLALIAVAAIGAISGVGQKMDGVFTTLDTSVVAATGS